MLNIKKLAIGTLLTLAVGATAYGLAHSKASEDCCCDFSDGKIVCTITGQELASCCCE